MLDSVRHFFNKDEVKQLLDAMALHELNVFHWHLDDDSGWRIEILKWPLLTQVSAWRTNTMFGLNPRSSTAWSDIGLYGGDDNHADGPGNAGPGTQRRHPPFAGNKKAGGAPPPPPGPSPISVTCP